MRYKPFGATGIKLSAFGFGGAKFRNGKSNQENAERVLYAIERGINHFDSCPGYSNSEEIFGLAAKQAKRDELYVSTKNQPAFFESKWQSLEEIEQSLESAGLDYFDFYYLWNVKRYSEYESAISADNQYEALLDAKAQGLVRHICLSSHLDAADAMRIVDDGKIEGLLLNLNILNFPYAIDAAMHAKCKGLGVGIMSPLYGGQIPSNEDKLSFLNLHGLSPTDEALAFAAGLWCADYAYVGFGSNEEVDRACAVADQGMMVGEDKLGQLREVIGSGLDKACCGCGYCTAHCPVNMPIAEYMLYYNYKHVFGMTQEDFERKLGVHKQWFMLAKRKADAGDCTGCGACARACTQHIDVVARLAELAEIEGRLGV